MKYKVKSALAWKALDAVLALVAVRDKELAELEVLANKEALEDCNLLQDLMQEISNLRLENETLHEALAAEKDTTKKALKLFKQFAQCVAQMKVRPGDSVQDAITRAQATVELEFEHIEKGRKPS